MYDSYQQIQLTFEVYIMTMKHNFILITGVHILGILYGHLISLQILLALDCGVILALIYKLSELMDKMSILSSMKSGMSGKPVKWPSVTELHKATVIE